MANPTVHTRCTAFIELPNPICAQCNDSNGIYKCRGCMKVFCELHAIPHREPLKIELRDLRREVDAMVVTVDNSDLDRKCKIVLDEIYQWEQQSLREIHRVAEEARSDVKKVLAGGGPVQQTELLACRDTFRARLADADKTNDYHERHLEYWRQFLVDLQKNFQRVRTVHVELQTLQKCLIRDIKLMSSTVQPVFEFTKWCYFERNCGPCIDLRRSGTYETRSCCDAVDVPPCRDVYIDSGVRNTELRYAGYTSQGSTYTQFTAEDLRRRSRLEHEDQISDTSRSIHRSAYEDSGRE